VTPVTKGVRIALFFWIESMVRSDEQRKILFDLDMNLLSLRGKTWRNSGNNRAYGCLSQPSKTMG
jgi:predicted 2-oxoglutarate/Fe(II)-dependent dioxygenase YbiX